MIHIFYIVLTFVIMVYSFGAGCFYGANNSEKVKRKLKEVQKRNQKRYM